VRRPAGRFRADVELRTDPLTGAVVAIVGSRQARPNRPPAGCPFCVGGLEAPEPYQVRAFPNRWPTFPDGRCEVVLFSPDHGGSLAGLGAQGARAVIDLWAERTTALGGRPDVAYVLVFENRGPEVGATIDHPHGQIFAYGEVPELPARELRRALDHGCPLCGTDPGERLVTTSGGWRAEVPVAAGYPFALLLSPTEHRPDLPSLSGPERDELAAVLTDALARLDRLFDAPMPYMLWIHQRPTDGGDWPQAHLHVEVAPILRAPGVQRFVAGAELGGGMLINPIVPEDAAARLREA
jgi:UDPglucose--hexose-1-phosphate uridylyltransferase